MSIADSRLFDDVSCLLECLWKDLWPTPPTLSLECLYYVFWSWKPYGITRRSALHAKHLLKSHFWTVPVRGKMTHFCQSALLVLFPGTFCDQTQLVFDSISFVFRLKEPVLVVEMTDQGRKAHREIAAVWNSLEAKLQIHLEKSHVRLPYKRGKEKEVFVYPWRTSLLWSEKLKETNASR